ncbi:hypothetical protein [Streptomyces colonosanans]|uniref:hypothetical protein n=1 Tax=Streptomyces colonosanans TaxID=1428652 RepID=UPI0015A60A04|nr:hypothetical protein [Streptomyces colonosanans]
MSTTADMPGRLNSGTGAGRDGTQAFFSADTSSFVAHVARCSPRTTEPLLRGWHCRKL